MSKEQVVPLQHRELTKEEHDELVQQAFDLEAKIKETYKQVHDKKWQLAEYLYEFSELHGWTLLGFDTHAEWLAQPDLGLTRGEYDKQVRCWRDAVVVKQLPPSDLEGVEPNRVVEVLPAVMSGTVKIEDAIEDAKELSYSDVKEKYRPKPVEDGGPNGKLDASKEPAWASCPMCGSRVLESKLPPKV